MRTTSAFLFLVLVAVEVSGQMAAAPTSGGLLSFSLAPCIATSLWPNDRPISRNMGSGWIGPSPGLALSFRYRLPSAPLFVGTELGCSFAFLSDPWVMTILQGGLSAGLQSDPRSTFGLRLFGSAGYSFNSIRSIEGSNSSAIHLHDSIANGGTPYVGAGCELSWFFIPSLSVAAGVKLRYLLGLYADIGGTMGISLNLPLAGPRAEQRAAPLKAAQHPGVPTGRPGTDVERLTQSLAPQEPALLLLANETCAAIEPSINHGLDRNLQLAAGIHDALCVLGMACVPSSQDNASAAGSVKPPLQALRDGSGNSKDLSVLYCSLLMVLGVETAFITTPGRSFVAFALASSEEEIRKTSVFSDELVFREGKAWVPIEVSGRDSFLEGWRAGLAAWRKARKQARLWPVRAAEFIRESPGSGKDEGIPTPDWSQLVVIFRKDIALLVEREIHDRETELLAAVNQGIGGPHVVNALGVLYARYDLFGKAEVQFRAAVEDSEFAPALVNLGNLRLREGLPEEAESYYRRAAAAAPGDPAALLGLARSGYALRNLDSVREAYAELRSRSPLLAEQFQYLQLAGDAVATAAEADRMKDVMVWGE